MRWPANLFWLLLPLPALLSAQLAVGGDLALRSAHVWRGVTRSSRAVLQPSVFAAWQPAGWTVTAGVWSSSELGGLGTGDLTDAGSSRHHAELNYWLEVHTRIEGVDVRLGAIRYDVRGEPAPARPGAGIDTGEAYGAVTVPITDLTLVGATVAWDYDAVRGTYVEAHGRHYVPVLPLGEFMASLLLIADGGFSLGQEINLERSTESAHFAERGLTHIALSAAVRLTFEQFGAFVGGAVQFSEDPVTRRTRLAETSWYKNWFEAGAWLLIGRPARERR